MLSSDGEAIKRPPATPLVRVALVP